MLAPKRGFTIIELVITIVIISILATIAMVDYQGARDKSKDARAIADLEALAGGLTMFKADNKRYPVGKTNDGAFAPGNDFTSYNNGGSGYCAHSVYGDHAEWDSLGSALVNYLPSMPKPWQYDRFMRYCNGVFNSKTTSNFELIMNSLSTPTGNGFESWDSGIAGGVSGAANTWFVIHQ